MELNSVLIILSLLLYDIKNIEFSKKISMKKWFLASKLAVLLAIGLFAISCVPQSKMKYLQVPEGVAQRDEFNKVQPGYKLHTGDFLYIRVYTLDQKSNEVFANITGGGGTSGYMNLTEQNLYLSSYMVDDSGFISFPLLGKLPAAGKTINELEISLNSSVSEIIKESSVIVKLVLYNISVLGEVKAPGKYTIYNNRVNIFEALALAHDLTSFANRSNIKIIRKEESKTRVITINLQNRDILQSPDFYLQPDDIIYVEPLKNKSYAFETFPYTTILAAISTVFIIATYFK
jgi:polysaccharide export outer membrane protein